MLVYRIGHKDYAGKLEASGANGRWASAGKMVIYAAQSIELAFLESMIRRQGVGFNRDFVTVVINLPGDQQIEEVKTGDLKDGWRDFRDYRACQFIGNKWYDDLRTPILKVPSAILPQSHNYVLHTLHPEFRKVSMVSVDALVPDERIEGLLKGNAHDQIR
jgi:RES domain-containing protein